MNAQDKGKEPTAKVAYISFKGTCHPINQDYIKVDEDRMIFLISDGIGSCAESYKASRAGVEAAYISLKLQDFRRLERMEKYEAFRIAMRMANTQVCQLIESSKALSGNGVDILIGGSTLDIGVVVDDFFYFAHVGDGRIYKREEQGLRQLTKDVVVKGRGIQVFDSWIGCDQENLKRMNMQAGRTQLHKGDKILMCTDGIYQGVSNKAIDEVVNKKVYHPLAKLGLLHCAAVEAGSIDDCSGILYERMM